MANTKISQAWSKPALEATDMMPVAKQGSLQAYHVTGQTLFDSLPAATTASKGTVELATAAETQAGTDAERAVTPASLIGAIGPQNLVGGVHYIGSAGAPPLTATMIFNAFHTATGRNPAWGELIVCGDNSGGFYLFFYHTATGAMMGFNLWTGAYMCVY
jgi:hypothetical protein